MITIKDIENYKDFGRCVEITNGTIEAYVTVDLGPRIIRFGFVGGQNIMCDDRVGLGGLDDKVYTDFFGEGHRWENLGGHRIWISPESYPETYTPDDSKVEYIVTENGVVFVHKVNAQIGLQKQFEVQMDPDSSNMTVTMRVKNIGKEDKTFAVWGISVCASNGNLIIPTNTNNTGLLPNRFVSIWPYTDMSDNRIYWGKKYVILSQDTNAKSPIKLGFNLNCGSVYYVLGDDVFCKSYKTNHCDAVYPDGNVSFETYTNSMMIEVESLSELKTVAAGEEHSNTEYWSLCKKPCEVDFKNDGCIDDFLGNIKDNYKNIQI